MASIKHDDSSASLKFQEKRHKQSHEVPLLLLGTENKLRNVALLSMIARNLHLLRDFVTLSLLPSSNGDDNSA